MKSVPVTGKTETLDINWCRIVLYSISPTEVVLMDTAIDETPELLDFFAERGQKVVGILCSHPHIDHIANNKLLCEHFGCSVYLSQKEKKMIDAQEWPYREYDFSYPLIAIPNGATEVTIHGCTFGILETPGHTDGHLSFITPDNVCYLGDAMMSKTYAMHSKLPYMKSMNTALMTMESLMETHYDYYVAAHKGTFGKEELRATSEENIRKHLSISKGLEELLHGTMPVEYLAELLLKDLEIREELWHKKYVFGMAVSHIYTLEEMGIVSIKQGSVTRV